MLYLLRKEKRKGIFVISEPELCNGPSRIIKVGEPQRSARLKINRVKATWSDPFLIEVLLPVIKVYNAADETAWWRRGAQY